MSKFRERSNICYLKNSLTVFYKNVKEYLKNSALLNCTFWKNKCIQNLYKMECFPSVRKWVKNGIRTQYLLPLTASALSTELSAQNLCQHNICLKQPFVHDILSVS